MTALVPEAKLFRMRRSIIWYEDLVFLWIYEHVLQFEVIFYRTIVFLEAFFTVIAPPMVQSPWNFESHLLHVFNKFRKVSSFRLGFIGFWVYLATPLFNDPVTANQRTKFNIYLDNYWSRESREYYCSGLIETE